ncbi:MAG: hypothetical protein HKN74_09435, partial [Acidimicrobiia bacterium]|nr:hypothetical protein [Acidimicrobiia bacterium]
NVIGGAALVLAVIGGTAAGLQLVGSSSEPDPDAVTASQLATGDDTVVQTEEIDPAETVVFDWERIELPLPYAADVWNAQVASVGDGFAAVANAFTGDSDTTTITWTSTDGRSWAVADQAAGLTGTFDALLSTGSGFVAVPTTDGQDNGVSQIFSSSDGLTWSAGSADFGPLPPNEYAWFTSAAAGPETTVLAGTLTAEPPQPPILFPEAGIRLEQDYHAGELFVYDIETGALLTSVPTSSIYGDGTVRLYDKAGNTLLEIPQEELDDLFRANPSGITIERDGIRLEIDFESSFTFRATSVADGTLLLEGDVDELYQPTRLTVTDPNSGNVLLDIPMDEFYAAEQRSYRDVDYVQKSEPLVLVTSDGGEWVRADLPITVNGAEGMEVAGVTYGPEGFVISVVHYGEDYRVDALASSDGRSWEITDSSNDAGAELRISWDGAYYTTRPDRSGRSEVARSTDGVNWTTVHQSPSRDAFYHVVAGGDFGLVAVGQGHSGIVGPPLTISKEGRTMTMDYESGRVSVVDDATGETLTAFEFNVFDEDAPAQFQVDDDAGTVTITDEDGTVLMTVTEAEGEAAVAEQERTFGTEETLPYPVVAYSPDGSEWFTATTVGLDLAWSQSVSVGSDGVVIVGESTDSYLEEIGADGDTIVLEDGSVEATYGPAGVPVIWFGTTR